MRAVRACIHRVSRGVACSRVFAEEINVIQSFMRIKLKGEQHFHINYIFIEQKASMLN